MQKQTNRIDCSFIQSNLFSYQEKRLSDEIKKEFEDHLTSCDECSSIVSDFKTVISVIERKKSEESNPFTQTRILNRLESQMKRENEQPIPLFHRILRPITVSFMLVVAMLIGFSLIKQRHESFADINNHQSSIQAMKSELNIPDFIDEDNTFFDNH
jgi:hypothetical protein